MTTPTLPPLRDDRVDAIETAVFARIADERTARRRRRRAVWTGVGAAAAVVVGAAVVGPALTSPTSTAGSSVVGVSEAGGAAIPGLSTGESAEGLRDMSGAAISGDASAASGVDGSASRDIVATGSSTVAVDDVTAAIATITDAATSAGGYVQSSQLGGGVGVVPLDGMMSQPSASSAWITVRVPADALASVMDGLSAVGDVTATSRRSTSGRASPPARPPSPVSPSSWRRPGRCPTSSPPNPRSRSGRRSSTRTGRC